MGANQFVIVVQERNLNGIDVVYGLGPVPFDACSRDHVLPRATAFETKRHVPGKRSRNKATCERIPAGMPCVSLSGEICGM